MANSPISAENIDSSKSLEAWLADKPAEWSAGIAWRAAMRVFPLSLADVELEVKKNTSGNSALSVVVFRALVAAQSVLNAIGNPGETFVSARAIMNAKAAIPNSTLRGSTSAAYTARATDSAASLAAMIDATASISRATTEASVQAANVAAETVASTAAAIAADEASRKWHSGEIWRQIRADAQMLESDVRLLHQPLWTTVDLKDLATISNGYEKSHPEYAFLLQWYRSVLDNGGMNPQMTSTDVVDTLSSDKFWEQPEQEILDGIARTFQFTSTEHDSASSSQATEKNPQIDQGTEAESSFWSEPDIQDDAPEVTTPESSLQSAMDIQDDAPEVNVDLLDRGPFAIGVAREIHRLWMRNNAVQLQTDTSANNNSDATTTENTFIINLDAQWGGGKTTFANFIAATLNPHEHRDKLPSFLQEETNAEGDIYPFFVAGADDEVDLGEYPPIARRSWCVARFNAWQIQHVKPPWWNFYREIRDQFNIDMQATGKAQFDANGHSDECSPDQRAAYTHNLKASERRWKRRSPKVVRYIQIALLFFVSLIVAKMLQLDTAAIATLALGSFGSMLLSVITFATENIAPNTNSIDEKLSLGQENPYQRFTERFNDLCEEVDRPILILIDDIDRCEPEYIVELVHGLQTILKCSRVLYVLIGDRNWIEQAYDQYFAKMAGKRSEHESTLGTQFLEKAIQFSLLLPRIDLDRKKDFVNRLLGLNGTTASAPVAVEKDMRERVKEELKNFNKLDSLAIQSNLETSVGLNDTKNLTPEQKNLQQYISREVVKTGTARNERKDIEHRLSALAQHLPDNPRQIKRIINTVSIYQMAARLRTDMNFFSADAERNKRNWNLLALWVVLVLTYPSLAERLVSYPPLLEILKIKNSKEEEQDKKHAQLFSNEALRKEMAHWLDGVINDEHAMRLLQAKHDNDDDVFNVDSIAEVTKIVPVNGVPFVAGG